jgi:hypothetical protein
MKSTLFRLSFFLVLCSWCAGGECRAQGEASKPYDLHIVVHVAKNRLLTDVFRDRIERELHDGFQGALGDMGRVKVTHEHPRLPDVVAQGLKVLDGWTDRDEVKTHFVLIDFTGVHYEIEARQYDGSIGRPSPVVRRDRTRDRDFVAKAAALLIKQDFGFLGTVLTAAEEPEEIARVELRGGALGDLSRWVKKDDVFALAPPGGGRAAALEWSLLQVREPPREDARDGICVCRFFHRYRVGSIAGYRCIKLGTVQTPLRLRWLPEETRGPRSKKNMLLNVDIRRHGFTGEDATKLNRGVGPNGVLETVRDGDKGVFQNVAFVVVASGAAGKTKPQIPIALVDDQPVFIKVNIADDIASLLDIHRRDWQGDVYESWLVQVGLFKELESLSSGGGPREEIIKKAERGLKRSQDDRATLAERKEELLKEAKESGAGRLDIAREDQRLQEIANGEKALEQFIAQQKKIEATENDPKMKTWKSEVERAKLLENDLEIGKALEIYQKIQKEGFKNADLDDHVKGLQELWKTGDAELEDARNFIYRVWPTLDTARLEDNMAKARQTLDKFEKERDIVSIRKLLKGTEIHADRLAKELNELNPKFVVADEKQARLIQSVSGELIKLGKKAQEYLQRTQPAEK